MRPVSVVAGKAIEEDDFMVRCPFSAVASSRAQGGIPYAGAPDRTMEAARRVA
jgi:hypothetical protein